MIQLSASSRSSIQPKRIQAGRRAGLSPPPPWGAPSTRHGAGRRSPSGRLGGVTRVSGGPAPSDPDVLMPRRYLARLSPFPRDLGVVECGWAHSPAILELWLPFRRFAPG